MAPPSGSAAYKKRDGTLRISDDSQSISWVPAGGASGSITLPVGHITSMLFFLLVSVAKLGGWIDG